MLKITTVVQKAGIPNANGRIYPESVLRAVEESFNELNKSSKNCVLGTLDNPPSAMIPLGQVSHLVESMKFNEANKELVACIRTINTPCGKILEQIIDETEFVLFGIGSETNNIVDDNYKFISISAIQKRNK